MAAAKQERLSAFASCVKYVEITWRKNPTCPGASDVEAGLERAFANCNPRKDKISIVVANDSYAEYSILRDFLKAREYDLRPIVGKEGTFVADQGGTNQKAE